MTNDNVSALTAVDDDGARFAKIKEAFDKLPNPWIKENAQKALSGAGPLNWEPNPARDHDLETYKVAYKVIAGVVRSGIPYVDNAGLDLIRKVFFCEINAMLKRWNMDCGPLYDIYKNVECGSPARSRGISREARIR